MKIAYTLAKSGLTSARSKFRRGKKLPSREHWCEQ